VRIAMVAPPWIAVPPHGYGGIEWVVSLLVEELVARGHEVTLFASGGSNTVAELVSVFDDPPTLRMHLNVPDARHAQRAFAEIAEREGTPRAFDVVHDHSACIFLAAAPLLPVPMVHTIHGAFTDEMKQLYGGVRGNVSLVAISNSQAQGCPELNIAAVVPNAVDVEGFQFRAQKGDYLLCLGRVCRDKGQDVAIAVAKRAGLPLVLAGKVDAGEDRLFFDEHVLPHLDGEHVRFEGEVSDDRKRDLIASARAMLFPIRWAEPFGLVMIEGMACGTPVVAMRWGAVSEVVTDGVTGFIVDDEDAMIDALARLDQIDPATCREDVLKRFSPSVMADGYERVYAEAIARRSTL
jgi:glycosyltransferase involved in cell wall biosynthesis